MKKRITNMLFVGALACAAQSAWSESWTDRAAADEAVENSEATVAVAAMGSPAVREEPYAAPKAQKRESMLQTLGLSPGDGFPSRGGPIDD